MPYKLNTAELKHHLESLEYRSLASNYGKIEKVVGLTIEATGLYTHIGDLCSIYTSRHARDRGDQVSAEVVGIQGDKILLMPYGDLRGIGPGSIVESTGSVLRIPVGPNLAGRIIDGFGNPIDGLGDIQTDDYYEVTNRDSNPLNRPRIEKRLSMGVKAIDGLLTVGEGQRIGIFSGSGVGKSTLLGMIARNVEADINVISLVGERTREVREFIERDLKEKGMARSVLVVATGDQSAMMRMKCAMTATTIAEYYKDRGLKVLLMMDSLTRFAMAQRDIGLAAGEPPVTRGYTPSLNAEMPKLLERVGKFENGSITGIYTVLVEGDDVNEPISDMVRGTIDGHIILSRSVAQRNHYPAIDVLQSVSRLMNDIADPDHLGSAGEMRSLMNLYYEKEELINVGAYKRGVNPRIDEAISKIDRINAFLRQDIGEKVEFSDTVRLLKEAIK